MGGLLPPAKRDRRARIKKLELAIKDRGKKPIKQVIALFCINEDVSQRKVREYLRLLQLAKKIDESIKF